MAIFLGLRIAEQMGFACLKVEMDASAAVNALLNGKNLSQILTSLLDDCRRLISYFEDVCVRHIYDEANKYANWLANTGRRMKENFIMHIERAISLCSLFLDDVRGNPRAQLCCCLSFC